MTPFDHPAFDLLAQGQLPEAAAEARRGLTEHPDDPHLLACLAEATAATDPAEARLAMDRASAARPDDAALLLAAARVQWRTGDHKTATSTAQRAAALAPDWAEGQVTSAVIALDQSQRGLRTSPEPDLYKRAKTASAKALASAPGWPLAYVVDGQAELADGNNERAIAAAKSALGLEPHNPQALVLLGDAEQASGDRSRAERIYAQASPWPPAAERLRSSAKERSGPNLYMAVMFGAFILSAIMRSADQPVIGIVFSLVGFLAVGMMVVDAVKRSRRRRTAARQEVARILTPGSELVGARISE